jgi:hypothetical protein
VKAAATEVGEQSTELALEGLTMTVPAAWASRPIKPGPMAPKAVFGIPGPGGEAAECTVRITHFPNMKKLENMERQNIDRWISQVVRADGHPSTRDDAKIEKHDLGAIRLTTVDLTGTVMMGMRGMGAGSPNHRMIAAIVDHPQGPHFVKATGPAAPMDAAEDAILAFLKSAKVK